MINEGASVLHDDRILVGMTQQMLAQEWDIHITQVTRHENKEADFLATLNVSLGIKILLEPSTRDLLYVRGVT